MDQLLLSQVIEELSRSLAGGRVDRVYQDERSDILLSVSSPGKKHALLLSADRGNPHLFLSTRKHPARPVPDIFVLFLRSHILRANIVRIGSLNGDRIVDIRFRKHGKDKRVLAELFGPHANIIVTDENDRILASSHPFPEAAASSRQLALGSVYVAPLKREGGNAARVTEHGEAVGRTANQTAEELYERSFSELEETALRQELARTLKKALVRARRKEEAVAADLASAERAEELRAAGEQILKNLRTIRKGERSVILSGYDGSRITVQLDPVLSPAGNADRYFKRYKKAKAGKSRLAARMEMVRAETAHLQMLSERVNTACDTDSLHVLQSEVRQAGLALTTPRRAPAAAQTAPPPGHRVFSSGEWEILVGKSARGNDALTRDIARPDDLWLHAEGMPGSHVLVRNPGKAEVPAEILQKAASLAAYYSSGREADKVSVVYTQVRYVKKPKGAPPGLVTLSRKRSLMARPSPAI